jgi:hypothetical protein
MAACLSDYRTVFPKIFNSKENRPGFPSTRRASLVIVQASFEWQPYRIFKREFKIQGETRGQDSISR